LVKLRKKIKTKKEGLPSGQSGKKLDAFSVLLPKNFGRGGRAFYFGF